MQKKINDIHLIQIIGQGQFGKVYLGINKKTKEKVALKQIRRSMLVGKFEELLINEIQTLKQCCNKNIILLMDVFKTKDHIYLVFEYCKDGDIDQQLKKKKFQFQEAVDIFIQILQGFEVLQKNNIMHRDLKLANILFQNGVVKITDFGFSKQMKNIEQLTQTMLGSPLTMAPEILQGSRYNSVADVWSLGCCFFELIYNCSPFDGRNQQEILLNILTKQLKFPHVQQIFQWIYYYDQYYQDLFII